MEPTKPKLPIEAVQLYNRFIHGEMTRRDFLDGVQRLAVGGLAASRQHAADRACGYP